MEQKEATGTVDLRPATEQTEGVMKKEQIVGILKRMQSEEPKRIQRGEKPSLPKGFALEGEKAFSLPKEARLYEMVERKSNCQAKYWTIWLKGAGGSFLAILLRSSYVKVLAKKAVDERYSYYHNAK